MRLAFFRVDGTYCEFLRQADQRVPYVMAAKAARPFVGIVFTLNEFNYYAPLTSPKDKHLHMKNRLDFFKINGGVWGAINFNNMIPVPEDCLIRVELRINSADSPQEIAYKNLLSNQLSWCNAHKEAILRQAAKLYKVVAKQDMNSLTARCCNFLLLEQQCSLYQTK